MHSVPLFENQEFKMEKTKAKQLGAIILLVLASFPWRRYTVQYFLLYFSMKK